MLYLIVDPASFANLPTNRRAYPRRKYLATTATACIATAAAAALMNGHNGIPNTSRPRPVFATAIASAAAATAATATPTPAALTSTRTLKRDELACDLAASVSDSS